MPSSGQPLSISHARAEAWRVLVLSGEIDLETAAGLNAAFTRAVRGPESLAVDLCDADASDAARMALLLNSVRRLAQRRRDVVIVCPPGPVRTALEQTAIARRLTLLEDARELYGRDVASDPGPVASAEHDGYQARGSTSTRRGALLAEATLAIEARHADPTLALDDVARAIATSNRQLQRVFSEQAGGAFRDEVAAVRMQRAAVLLQTTDLSVAEVAHRVGYRQAAQFAKAFRRQHGISPSGLRKARSGGPAAPGVGTPGSA
jgi:AraC family transcriptional regulator of adaptative response / methylphosphotriester-DNA alkyltransferase methyltransferase